MARISYRLLVTTQAMQISLAVLLSSGAVRGAAESEPGDDAQADNGVVLGLPTVQPLFLPSLEEISVSQPPAAVQQPAGPPFTIRLDLPGPEELFRPESEGRFRSRLVEDARKQKVPIEFPKDHAYPRLPEQPLKLPEQTKAYLPATVCFRPLYFQNDWTERYGLYYPCLQPLVSTGHFYLQTLTLPYHMVQQPLWTQECRDGY